MDTKVQALKAETSGTLSVQSLTCRDATQLADIDQPDAVLLSINPKTASSSSKTTQAAYGPYSLFVVETLNAEIDNSGSYKAVPNTGQWRVLNENVALGRSQELPSYFWQLWEILTGLTTTSDLNSPHLVNLDVGGGIGQDPVDMMIAPPEALPRQWGTSPEMLLNPARLGSERSRLGRVLAWLKDARTNQTAKDLTTCVDDWEFVVQWFCRL